MKIKIETLFTSVGCLFNGQKLEKAVKWKDRLGLSFGRKIGQV